MPYKSVADYGELTRDRRSYEEQRDCNEHYFQYPIARKAERVVQHDQDNEALYDRADDVYSHYRAVGHGLIRHYPFYGYDYRVKQQYYYG